MVFLHRREVHKSYEFMMEKFRCSFMLLSESYTEQHFLWETSCWKIIVFLLESLCLREKKNARKFEIRHSDTASSIKYEHFLFTSIEKHCISSRFSVKLCRNIHFRCRPKMLKKSPCIGAPITFVISCSRNTIFHVFVSYHEEFLLLGFTVLRQAARMTCIFLCSG